MRLTSGPRQWAAREQGDGEMSDIEDLTAQLTVEEKARLVMGGDFWHS